MEIPRNIRQIGDIDRELGLYLEDYVATFIEKMRRKNETCIGILLGRQEMEQKLPCLFVRGAVVAKDYEIEDGRVIMTASAWNDVYEQAEKCFKEVEICGWFLCSNDSRVTDLYTLQKSHSENFRSQNQILFVYDGNREEETVYRFDTQGGHRLRGYYIYYERNEQMQEYMISQEPVRKSEFAIAQTPRGVSDEVTRQFRNIMEGKQEKEKEPPSGANPISKLLRTVSVTALLCGAGFGLAAWYKYDGMQGIKEVASVLSGGQKETVPTEESGVGQALVQEVAGEVKPTEKPSEGQVGNEETMQASRETKPTGGASLAETSGEETTRESQTETPTKSPTSTRAESTRAEETEKTTEAAEAAAGPYQEYIVKSGDTLSLICKEFYGEGSPSLVEEICKFNGMANANLIYEGQVLKLPER
ncbi:MAG: LysM peptidoglycan-binding domain-containing protein [Lachnospiraceae bacterium]|nr:LysM peptidoglycan-binding domain-containing protein [Lachnospiraceae bacterium]